MKRVMRWAATVAWGHLASGHIAAQQQQFFYPAPPAGTVRVSKGIRFTRVERSISRWWARTEFHALFRSSNP